MPRALAVKLALAIVAVGAVVVVVRWRASVAREERLRAVDVGATCPDAQSLGEVCGRCVAAFCCADLRACYGSSDCVDLNDCTVKSAENEGRGGTPRSRIASCLAGHAPSVKSFLAWDGCARKNCQEVCPRGPEED